MRKELEELRGQTHTSSSAVPSESTFDLDVNLSSTDRAAVEVDHDLNFSCTELSLDGTVVDAALATDALQM